MRVSVVAARTAAGTGTCRTGRASIVMSIYTVLYISCGTDASDRVVRPRGDTAGVAPPTRTPRAGWIDAGLRALAAGGPDAVRIEPLARELGVTRGGFYGHFKSRAAFLDALLDTWERRSTEEVLERVEREGG